MHAVPQQSLFEIHSCNAKMSKTTDVALCFSFLMERVHFHEERGGGKGTVNEHLRIARGAVLFHRGRRTDAKTGPMAAIARLVESYVLDVYFCC